MKVAWQIKFAFLFIVIASVFSGIRLGMERQGVTWSNVWYASYEAQMDVVLSCMLFVGLIAMLALVGCYEILKK